MRDGYAIKKSILTGKQAKSDGDFFERMIDEACERYKINKLAYIDKTPEPMKPLRPIGKGQFVACYQKQAQPDYKGTLLGGRSIVFEAKMTSSDRILQDRVTSWQMEALKEHQFYGADVFILIYFMNHNSCFKIPIDVWGNMKVNFGRKYIKPDELGDYSIPTSGMIIDFLKTRKRSEDE